MSYVFDLSKYSTGHHLYNIDNKMVTLKIEDELALKPIEKFVGLKPIMYPHSVKKSRSLSSQLLCVNSRKKADRKSSQKY